MKIEHIQTSNVGKSALITTARGLRARHARRPPRLNGVNSIDSRDNLVIYHLASLAERDSLSSVFSRMFQLSSVRSWKNSDTGVTQSALVGSSALERHVTELALCFH